MVKPPGEKPLSKRRQAELRAACRLVGLAFAEFLMTGEEATTDWQIAIEMVGRLQAHMSPAEWERFAFVTSWPYSDIAADLVPDNKPDRPVADRMRVKKLALH